MLSPVWFTMPYRFRSTPFVRRLRTVSARGASTILFLLLVCALLPAVELKQVTLQAWAAYVQSVNSAMEQRASGRTSFLWADESPDNVRRLRAGEIIVAKRDPGKVPHGLISHWIGATFIPNVTLERVVGVLGDYEHYSDFYKPIVVKSTVLDRGRDVEKARLLMMQKAYGVTGAVEIDDEIRNTKLDADRIYSFGNAIRVQEIADFGRPNEHPYPEDRRPGYVWRTAGVKRLEQRDGGVYVEIETIVLSRDIPFEFRWLIQPLTDSLPRKLMLETLKDARDAVVTNNVRISPEK